MIVFSIAVCVQASTIILESNTITAINGLIVIGTFLSYWVMITIANVVPSLSFFGVCLHLLGFFFFWKQSIDKLIDYLQVVW